MATEKLYRALVFQRVSFTPGTDSTYPGAVKPPEIEGNSVVRDVTSFVKGYSIPRSKEALVTEAKVTFINERGELTPENHKSQWNLSPLDGTTYTPLLGEGNEIRIYRITDDAYLDPSFRDDEAKWVPRFRGYIRSVTFGTESGQDSLEITAGGILSQAAKNTMSGVFSPIVRSSSVVPNNSFFTTARMTAALAKLRDLNGANVANEATAYITPPSIAQPGEIPAELLARLIYWDQPDTYYSLAKAIGPFPRFALEAYAENIALAYLPVTADTITGIYNLNGKSWYAAAGTVTKDSARVLDDAVGSLKVVGTPGTPAVLTVAVRKVVTGVPSRFSLAYRIEDGSTAYVKITRKTFTAATQAYSNPEILTDTLIDTGPTTFTPANLGGTLLNAPSGTTYEWRRKTIDLAAISSSYATDTEASQIHYVVEIYTTGTIWIDNPRWEFTMVDVAPDTVLGITSVAAKTAMMLDNNVSTVPALERWTTTDGIVYLDPYPQHRSIVPKQIRVIARNIRAPYAAGTDAGYGPVHLRSRYLPESYMYEKELVEGQDYETLVDKGGISITSELSRSEIFVAHASYDLSSSSHMEAGAMIKHLLANGCGIPTSLLSFEDTGIILSRVSLGIQSTTTVLQAIQDILKQIPGNYLVKEDGAGRITGKFVQQEGSPRIYNPVIQTPIMPTNSTILANGIEYWYGVTAIMPDGKETLLSNLISTVDYANYFDAAHQSLVNGTTCPALKIKSVPNYIGLVIRRGKAYKAAADTVAAPAMSPTYAWTFDSGTPLVSTTGTATFTDSNSAFGWQLMSEVVQDPDEE